MIFFLLYKSTWYIINMYIYIHTYWYIDISWIPFLLLCIQQWLLRFSQIPWISDSSVSIFWKIYKFTQTRDQDDVHVWFQQIQMTKKQCSVFIRFLQPKDWSEWSNTCYDVEVDQPWAHAASCEECQQSNGWNDSNSWNGMTCLTRSLYPTQSFSGTRRKMNEVMNLCQDVAISNMPAGLQQMSVT